MQEKHQLESPKSLPVSYYQNPGFTVPNFHQIYMLAIILTQQLHNQTQLCTGSVLTQPFAILMSAITTKGLNQTEDMD